MEPSAEPVDSGRSGFTVPEEIKEALVDPLDGSQELINPHGFASYFVCGRARGYGVAQLSGAADTFSGQQRQHRATPSYAHDPLHLEIPLGCAHLLSLSAGHTLA